MYRMPRVTVLALATGLIVAIGPSAGSAPTDSGARAAASAPTDLGAKAAVKSVGVDEATEIALDHLRATYADQRVGAADVAEVAVTDAYTSEHTGVTHVYLRQQRDGIDIRGATMVVNVASDGDVIYTASQLVDIADNQSRRSAPSAGLDAAAATTRAAKKLDLQVTEDIEPVTGRAQRATGDAEVVLSKGGISTEPIPARQVYEPTKDGRLRLAWNLGIVEPSGKHAWNATVDAATGELLDVEDYIESDNPLATAARVAPPVQKSSARRAAPEAATAMTGGHPSRTDGARYRVYPWPMESPQEGDRELVTDPADALGSPFGWHDTNGARGPEFTTTRGNNVHAYTDTDNTDFPDAGSSPDGGPGLTFDFPIKLNRDASAYSDATVTNLYYWNNIVHDVMYRYGFTEAAGNFQVNNYGNGGKADDSVRAEAYDGSGINSANFYTPVDGNRPRMQMYQWDGNYYGELPAWFTQLPNLVTVNKPSSAAGSYQATDARFGPPATNEDLDAEMVLLEDDSGAPADGCDAPVGFPDGAIALVYRTDVCEPVEQVANAEAAGAVAVVVVDHDGTPDRMYGEDPGIGIPAVMISKQDGATILDGLPASGEVRPNPQFEIRASSLDASVVIHEYGHGLSYRLTGGPNTNCLGGAQDMGQGWSDWYAMAFLARPGDTGAERRGIGTYITRQGDRNEKGIRYTAYSTDMDINPTTYGDLPELAETYSSYNAPGYVWATALWEVYWNLVDEYGFNPNVYADWSTGGNNLAIQLVTDGLKFQGCNPGLVDARDGILAADQALTGGDNQCALWQSFSKRGLGYSAVQGPSTRLDITEAFDTHPDCAADVGVDTEQLDVEIPAGSTTVDTVRVTNNAPHNGESLDWTATTARTSCARPEDVPWLGFPTEKGSIPPASARLLEVALDASQLPPGTVHEAIACLDDDTGETVAEIPVTLRVGDRAG